MINEQRANRKPLHLARDIYNVLVLLQVGDRVPDNILIHDYANGYIPWWMVREREDLTHVLILTLTDESNINHPNKVAIDIFTAPGKTIGGRLYQWFPGCIHARNMFSDIRQHARSMCDKWTQQPAPRPQPQTWQPVPPPLPSKAIKQKVLW